MGCDIHCFAEKRRGESWEALPDLKPVDYRSYGVFAFLAGVRNYSAVPPIAEPRGFPGDASPAIREEYVSWGLAAHTPSWLTIEELRAFPYDATVEDRRVTRQTGPNSWDGGCTAEPGGGEEMTWREFLGEDFFTDLDALSAAGADRIVFWFDN